MNELMKAMSNLLNPEQKIAALLESHGIACDPSNGSDRSHSGKPIVHESGHNKGLYLITNAPKQDTAEHGRMFDALGKIGLKIGDPNINGDYVIQNLPPEKKEANLKLDGLLDARQEELEKGTWAGENRGKLAVVPERSSPTGL